MKMLSEYLEQTSNFAVWGAMKMLGSDCTLEHVENQRFDNPSQLSSLRLENAVELDMLLTATKESVKAAQDRRSVLTEKMKNLATLSSLVLGVGGLLLPKPIAFSQGWSWLLLYIAAGCFFVTVWMLLSYARNLREVVFQLTQGEVGLDSDNLKRSLINSYYQCELAHDERNRFLGTLYGAARLYFLIGLILVGIFMSIRFFSPQDVKVAGGSLSSATLSFGEVCLWTEASTRHANACISCGRILDPYLRRARIEAPSCSVCFDFDCDERLFVLLG